jgi:6-phosphogluconate dehydrogenase
MQLGIIGLGKMGGNIAKRLFRAGHEIIVYDSNPQAIEDLVSSGPKGAESLTDFIEKLTLPRAVWLMLPAGPITQGLIEFLSEYFEPGDYLIDGGNTFYKDDISRANFLRAKGIFYVDVGTSGGVHGLDRGYCMMIGGEKSAIDHLDPIFHDLAPGPGTIAKTPGREGRDPRVEQGYIHAGPSGAGHFVKMIHNGIEYGLMQAYAEGFDILRNKASENLAQDQRFNLDLTDIAEVWRRGSVVSSWLLDLSAMALAQDKDLAAYSGAVTDSGEGRWSLEAAVEESVAAPVLAASLFTRFRSRQHHTFAEKLLSAMRFYFGGHVEPGGK